MKQPILSDRIERIALWLFRLVIGGIFYFAMQMSIDVKTVMGYVYDLKTSIEVMKTKVDRNEKDIQRLDRK
jgi:hypothetical protein